MLFFAPLITATIYYLMAIYVLAAVLPAVFLMRYVYRQDTIEKEDKAGVFFLKKCMKTMPLADCLTKDMK